MLKSFRYLLFPFATIYSLAIRLRNWLFDKEIYKSTEFNFPIICVGNLAVGGTGKTPMVEYLLSALQSKYKLATLSRGYKRRTKGFAIANENSTAIDIGDEPMQFYLKYPNIVVAVGEERIVAVPNILQERPDTELIILDDAFQHRSIKAGLNILLTDYENLYTRDFMIPTGDLRDTRSSASRADIIAVTKCKPDMTIAEKDKLIKEINPRENQSVFFTIIVYDNAKHIFSKEILVDMENKHCLLVTGIANPTPIKNFLAKHTQTFELLRFRDHHIFTISDLKEIKKEFAKIIDKEKFVITTEKDAMRLLKYKEALHDFPIYSITIKQEFLFDESGKFLDIVENNIAKYERK